jgi:hypothetical protein
MKHLILKSGIFKYLNDGNKVTDNEVDLRTWLYRELKRFGFSPNDPCCDEDDTPTSTVENTDTRLTNPHVNGSNLCFDILNVITNTTTVNAVCIPLEDINIVTSISLNNTNLEYVDEDGDTTSINLCPVVEACETVTTVVDNEDGTFTYTNEAGTSVTINTGGVETLTTLDSATLNGSNVLTIQYTGENGLPQSVSVNLSSLATDINIASMAYNPLTGVITITETDSTIHTVDIGPTLATNGLQMIGNDIGLGGSLIQATNIDGLSLVPNTGYAITFTNLASMFINSINGVGNTGTFLTSPTNSLLYFENGTERAGFEATLGGGTNSSLFAQTSSGVPQLNILDVTPSSINLLLDTASDFRINNIPGTTNQVLTSQGASVPPIWQSISALISANNGTSLSGSTVQLGGNLLQNTTVTNNGFSLSIAGTTSTIFASDGKIRINNPGTAPANLSPSGALRVQIGNGGNHLDSGVYINGASGSVGLRMNQNSYIQLGDGNTAGINTANIREEAGVLVVRTGNSNPSLSLSTNPSFSAATRIYNVTNIIPQQLGYAPDQIGNAHFNVWCALSSISQQQTGIRIIRGVPPTANYFTQYIQSSNGSLAWNSGVQGASNNDVGDTKRMELTNDGKLGINTTSAPLSNLEVSGSIGTTITTHNTANPTITDAFTQYFTTGASGTFTLTSGAILGRIYNLINYSGVNITLTSNVENGNGSTTNTLNSNARFQIQWTGAKWILLNGA